MSASRVCSCARISARIATTSDTIFTFPTGEAGRKIRVTVSAFGRFMDGRLHMITSVVAHEGDPARGGQGHAPASADDSHTEADRSDLQSSLSSLPTRPAEAGF